MRYSAVQPSASIRAAPSHTAFQFGSQTTSSWKAPSAWTPRGFKPKLTALRRSWRVSNSTKTQSDVVSSSRRGKGATIVSGAGSNMRTPTNSASSS
jgi:hypothetical protein